MANQMIALSGRPAQIRSPGSLAQQYGQVMNVLAQQRAAERQAAALQMQQQRTAQEMDLARQQRVEQARAADLEHETAQVAYARELSMAVRDDPTYQMWLGQVAERNPQWAAMIRQASPTYDPSFMTQLRADAAQFVNKTVATATAQPMTTYDEQGRPTITDVRVGGFGPPVGLPVQMYGPAAAGAPPAAGAPAPDAAQPMGAPVAAQATRGNQTGPQYLIDQGVPPSAIPMGNSLQRPIAMTTGGQPAAQPLTMETAPQIIQSAVQNRTIDESHLQQLRQMVGPENEQALAQWMQQNGVRITPAGQPAMRSAVYRPGVDAAPQMQQAQYVPQGYAPTGGRAEVRDPLVSPSQVPSSAGAVTGATTAASENVRVRTQPQIVAGEETARNVVDLRREVPALRAETETAVDNLTRRIQDIDDFLTNTYRYSVIGPIEGNLPGFAQYGVRSDMQALWNNIRNNEVLNDIIRLRGQTETGASPLGNVTQADLNLLIQAASRLTQTGDPVTQDNNMKAMRRELYKMRDRLIRRYNDTLRPLGENAGDYALDVSDVSPLYQGRAEPLRVTVTGGDVANRRQREIDNLVGQYTGGQ